MKKIFTSVFLLGLVVGQAASQNVSVNTDGSSGPGLFNVGNTATPPFQVMPSGQLLGKPDGSVTNPSYSFVGNAGTGMFLPAAGTIAFSTASTERMRLGNTGVLTLNYLAGTGNRLLMADATGNLAAMANGTAGQLLQSNGAAAPTWVDAGGLFIKNQTSQQATSNFNISGSGVVGTTMQAATYLFPAPAGDPSPVITARTVPVGQGNANERTELILFHSNDGANGSGEDLITLRAPALRFQTFTDANVGDVNNNAGSNDRMYINPAGQVSVNNLAGTGTRQVYADANGTLTTNSANSANNNWSISANFAFSPDDLGTTSIFADNTDDGRYVHTLPFTVTIEGVAYSQITICSNGWVAFGDVNSTAFNATALPASFTNNPVIFPFWTDLKDYGGGEYVVVRNEGTAPNRTVVVHFRLRALWGTTAVAEFQLQIHEGSGLMNVKYIAMAPTLNGQQWTGDATKNTAIGFQLGGGASAKAYPITFNGKVLDDNRSDREGWSVCPVR